jgi:hypothetical protein
MRTNIRTENIANSVTCSMITFLRGPAAMEMDARTKRRATITTAQEKVRGGVTKPSSRVGVMGAML